MKKFIPVLMLAVFTTLASAQEIIEKIEIVGNDRVTPETILYYVSSRENGYFNEEQIQRDFRVLWSTGFFADLKIEQVPGTRGVILRVTVVENPMVRSIVYKTGKKLKENDIVSKLKEKDENILPYSYLNPYKLQRIKDTISDLLAEKGLLAAKIDMETQKQGKNDVDVVIRIDEGPKLRVGEVVFEGNPKLPPNELIWSMKDNRPHTFFNWIAGKDVYKQNKLTEDIAAIKKKYQEAGYMEATVGPARVDEVTKTNVFLKKQTMMQLVVPVNPGYLYRVGEIKIEGNKAFNSKGLMLKVQLRPGEVYSTKDREKTVEDMSEVYRNWGYLYAQIMPVENLDPKNKRVNVTFNIYEGDVAYLHRLEFKGNNYTKDKVIRREMLIREGDRFSLAMFKDSVLRIRQLGLVDLEGEPDIKPNTEDPTKIDVVVPVKELQRNNIQFTAGYSGYEGAFVAFSYSTVNFLGAGENLEFMVQTGKRVRNYSFGFTEPYLFDAPLSAGFNIYDRRYDYTLYGLYLQKTRGIDLTLGARLIGYWRTSMTYTIQKLDVSYPENSESGAPVTPYAPIYGSGTFYESSITPMIYRSTIDSPLTPTRGTLYSALVKLAGGPLGGGVDLIKPVVEVTHYQPFVSNHVIGLHAQYEFILSTDYSKIPYWEKFFLGGERSIRGYEVYAIGPYQIYSSTGYPVNIGGEKAVTLNAEYIIPIGGPLYGIFFYDVGNAILHGQKFSLHNMYTSAGFEARIFVPALRVPFRLIFAYNNRKVYREASNFAFRFAVGTTF